MAAITVADVDNMSDTELYKTLKSYGFDVGPIVASTRGIYKKKLIEKLKTQPTTSVIPGLNSSTHDTSFHNDVVSHTVDKSSRNSVERPDSSNRYGDVSVSRSTVNRKSFSHFTTTSAAADDDDQEAEDYELEEEAERYERHSPSKLSQSYSSYSRQSYEPSTVGLGQSRASDYGRSVGDRLTADYSDPHTGVGSYRSSLGGFESTSVGSGYRSSLGETASERADRILEDIRRRSTLATGYRPVSETDHLSRTRDILEQARQSGRVSKSQTYGTQKSVLSEYFLKIIIGLVLFVCIYFIITSMTQPSSLQAIDQEVNEILKDSDKTNIE